MKTIPSLALTLSLLLPALAGAGPLYGTVKNAPAGTVIEVACPGFDKSKTTAKARTDAQGSYSLLVQASGRCQMRAGNGEPFEVFVSTNPLRFDFEVDGAMKKVR